MKERIARGAVTVIGKGTIINGNIKSEATILRIDGEVNGNITTSGELIIGRSGRVEGNIRAGKISIAGVHLGKVLAAKTKDADKKGKDDKPKDKTGKKKSEAKLAKEDTKLSEESIVVEDNKSAQKSQLAEEHKSAQESQLTEDCSIAEESQDDQESNLSEDSKSAEDLNKEDNQVVGETEASDGDSSSDGSVDGFDTSDDDIEYIE